MRTDAAAPRGDFSRGVAFDAHDQPLDEAIASARAARKPLALFFLASWCPHCTDLSTRTLPDPGVGSEMARFYDVMYDADRGPGRDAAKRLGVDGFPTVLLLDGNGRVVGNLPGFSEPRLFVMRVRNSVP
jgi:thioredoxin-related protein